MATDSRRLALLQTVYRRLQPILSAVGTATQRLDSRLHGTPLRPLGARSRELFHAADMRWRRLANLAVPFRCNICGADCASLPEQFGREIASCWQCGSTVRWRSIISALSLELFGESLALPDFPHRPDLRGLGLSDSYIYANRLSEKTSYVNTFYDAEPQFDILNPTAEHLGRYDFLISSDVFEHVPPAPVRAFEKARSVLRPGGVLVFSVPYSVEGVTKEHFPELHDYELVHEDGKPLLRNRTKDGRLQEFRELVFHGGPGFTLEMRHFSLAGIRQCVEAAGFKSMAVCAADDPPFGVYWGDVTWSKIIVARS